VVHSTKLIGAHCERKSQSDMSSHSIIQHITQQCRSSIQVCCSCRNKITTKKWSSSKLSRDLPVSWCGGHSFPDVI